VPRPAWRRRLGVSGNGTDPSPIDDTHPAFLSRTYAMPPSAPSPIGDGRLPGREP